MKKQIAFLTSLLVLLYVGCNSSSFPVVGGSPATTQTSASPAPTVTVLPPGVSTPAARFSVSVPALTTSGIPLAVTVTALNSDGSTDAFYSGTVNFQSSDLKATLPASNGLVNGVGNFSMKFLMGGPQTVTVTDSADAAAMGTSIPTSVIGASVSVGTDHACALSSSGQSLYCWGDNNYCEIGSGNSVINGATGACPGGNCPNPTAVSFSAGSLPSVITQVSAKGDSTTGGGLYTCALSSAGNVYCWGDDTLGQLGDSNTGVNADCSGSTANSFSLVEVPGGAQGGSHLSNIVAISTGDLHVCALSSTGNVFCWGNNQFGQLGNGATSSNSAASAPVEVEGVGGTGFLSNIVALATGRYASCAVSAAGNVYCWGSNNTYQLGNGGTSTAAQSLTPTAVVFGSGDLSGVVGITVETTDMCVNTAAGNVFCWGYNGFGSGQNTDVLGLTSSPPPADTPYQISNSSGGFLSGVATVAAARSGDDVCVLTTTGNVECWGTNNSSSFGDGLLPASGSYVAASTTPVSTIAVGASAGGALLTGAAALSTGQKASCVLQAASGQFNVACWGGNTNGVLGYSASSESAVPALVVGTSGSGSLAL